MKEYALIFRMDISPAAQPTQEQMNLYMQDWMKWIGSITAEGRLADGGNHLSYTEAMVLRPGNMENKGTYMVNKEGVAGYIIILADDLEEATGIARQCPILRGNGTSVEVREVASA